MMKTDEYPIYYDFTDDGLAYVSRIGSIRFVDGMVRMMVDEGFRFFNFDSFEPTPNNQLKKLYLTINDLPAMVYMQEEHLRKLVPLGLVKKNSEDSYEIGMDPAYTNKG